MSRNDETLSDAALDRLLEEARAAAPEPPAGLMARVLADAEAEIASRRVPAKATRPNAFRRLIGGLGGWPALASMVTATIAGIWLGFASPDALNTLAGGLLLPADTTTSTTSDLEDILPGYTGLDTISAEG